MKPVLLTLLLLTGISGIAQPVIVKQKAYGRAATGEFSVTQTNDGGLLTGGLFVAANADHTPWVYTLNKISKTGQVEWVKVFDSTEQNSYFGTTVLQLHDGNYAYCVVTGEAEITLFKFTPAGDLIWQKPIIATKNGQRLILGGVNCLKQTADDGFIMAADNFTLFTTILKLDAEANVRWYTIFEDTNFLQRAPYIVSVAETSEGNYLAAGTGGDNDYYIVPIDKNGMTGTAKTYHADGGDNCYSINNTADGGYMLSGVSDSKRSGVKTQGSRGDIDYWVIKLDHSLEVQWDRTLGGERQDFPTALAQTADGGYLVTGKSPSNMSVDKSENNKSQYYWQSDYWTIKLDKKGKIVWDKTIGGAADETPVFIGESEPGIYTLAGSSFTGISGDKTSDAKGQEDLWVLALRDSTSLIAAPAAQPAMAKAKTQQPSFTLYPNPAKDIVYIQTAGKARLTLCNRQGKNLVSTTINGKGTLNVAGLAPGIYYLCDNDTGLAEELVVVR